MASVGPQNPTAATGSTGTGTSWVDPTNVFSSDDTRASASLSGSGSNRFSRDLKVSGFDFSAIPDGSTIDGVVVEIERHVSSTSGSPRDDTIQLMKAGTAGGTNAASGSTWPTTDAYATYGGASDLWGNTLSTADIKDSGFGVSIKAVKTAGKSSTTARVDHIRITVYYTAGGGGKPTQYYQMMRNG